MPQLKKVVLAIGNTLIYRDTYEQALGDLSALMQGGAAEAAKLPAVVTTTAGSTLGNAGQDQFKESVRNRLRRTGRNVRRAERK